MPEADAFEKLDLFYLGRELDPASGESTDLPLLYRHKHLTTHAAIIGMTGSGKTGLGIGLIEEAAIDRLPAIVIDPKGDMGNLLLSFPDLSPADFQPWVDPAEAARKGEALNESAARTADVWRAGLKKWGQDGDRIRRMRQNAEFIIYTPGCRSGRPVSILETLSAPDPDLVRDDEAAASLVNSTVSSLLGLVGIKADPLKSREHIFLSSILFATWRKGQDSTLPALINAVVQPPFDKIGVFPLETFYPRAKRMELALQMNNIIASPAFGGWLEGDSLDIGNLLYTPGGKPRVAIFSIAHLGDAERMFFVSMLLGKLIGWMRRQEGSGTLRCLLYMDEIFGYFPPNADPPSKKPMLMLLKQARAFGIGIVLATQNPVDLDYKALANIGTWFLGRLQTSQDQDRVLTGIGADKQSLAMLRQWLGDMRARTFLMYSAHQEKPIRFEARWALSYLKGPMTLPEIERLNRQAPESAHFETAENTGRHEPASAFSAVAPVLSGDLEQRFVPSPMPAAKQKMIPWLAGSATVRFFNAGLGMDQREELLMRLPLPEGLSEIDWKNAEPYAINRADLPAQAPEGFLFAPVPAKISSLKNFREYEKMLTEFVYATRQLTLLRNEALKLESKPGESDSRFHARVAAALQEMKDRECSKIEQRYNTRLRQLENRLVKARWRIEKEKGDVAARGRDTALSIGVAVFGALFGRKPLGMSTAARAAGSVRNAGRILKEREDVSQALEEAGQLEEEQARISQELQIKLAEVADTYAPGNFPVEPFSIRPRRNDVTQVKVFLLWEPQLEYSGLS